MRTKPAIFSAIFSAIFCACLQGLVMANEFDGADALAVYHTNGTISAGTASEGMRQDDATKSTGNRGSTSRVDWADVKVLDGGIPGLYVKYISPACGFGSASLVATDANAVAFSSPGDELGAPVTIGPGETKLVSSASNESAYVLVSRRGIGDLAGVSELTIVSVFNNALVGSNIDKYEAGALFDLAFGGDDEFGDDNPITQHSIHQVEPVTPPPAGILKWYAMHVPPQSLDDTFDWLHPNYRGLIVSDAEPFGERYLTMQPDIKNLLGYPPGVFFGAEFTAYKYSGRLHCIMFANKGDQPVTNLQIYNPPLGSPQTIEASWPTNGLPASGAGTINIPDASDWHPNTRFVLVSSTLGLPRELVGGHLDGNTFVVGEYGRGLHGTTIAAGQANDVVEPVSGLQIGIDQTGVVTGTGQVQGTPIPPGESPTVYPETVLYDAQEITTPGQTPSDPIVIDGPSGAELPTPLGVWSLATNEADGLNVATLLPGQRVAVWLNLAVFPGELQTPVAPAALAWAYTRSGVRHEQLGQCNYRIARDLSAARYQLFRSTGENIPIDERSPIAVAASRSFVDVPIVDDAVNNFEVHRVNDYGIHGLVLRRTLERLGGTTGTRPSAPVDVEARQTADASITVNAFYFANLDEEPANQWEVRATNLETDSEIWQTIGTGTEAVRELLHTLSDPTWTAGVPVKVRVRVNRTADGFSSDWVERIVTMAASSLDDAGGLIATSDDRRQAKQE